MRELGQQLLAVAWESAHILEAEVREERLGEVLEFVAETQAQLAGLRMRLLQEAHAVGAYEALDRERTSPRRTTQRASADLRLAGHLAQHYGLIQQAVCDGRVSLAQAEAMVAGLRKLPSPLGAAELEECQIRLLAEADVLGPHELRILAARMVEIIHPDAADEIEAVRLAKEERRANAARSLRLKPDFHGSMRIFGQLPVADAALLEAQLDALMPPASSYLDRDVAPSRDARRADALVLLTQMAASAGTLPNHGKDRPQVVVTLTLDTLTSGLGAAGLVGRGDTERLTAAEARRMACDARIIPMVLGSHSQPLDIGRQERTVPKSLRAALTQRDQGCAFPHCTTAPAACEAHHIQPWWAGGDTSLANCVLLCPHHHRLVEPDPCQSAESQWQAQIHPATGLPEFIPPRHIDPARTPRQHRRFRLATMKLEPVPPSRQGAGPPPSADPPVPGHPPSGGGPSCPPRQRLVRLNLPPASRPEDDPWHPDYQPPARAPAAPIAATPR